jgi:integrase
MEAARGSWMEGPLVMALFLGLRRGEVCGLKWSAIDRKKMRVEIREQRHPLLPPGSKPKMQKVRTLPIHASVLERIDQLGDRSSLYIFTMKNHQPIRPNSLSDAMEWLCRDAGIKRQTFHDLRSEASSNLAALGADPWSIMEILGHTKMDMSMLYVNQRERNKRDALGLLIQGEEKRESV